MRRVGIKQLKDEAPALLAEAAIWSDDDDLAGRGVATWRTAVLAREVAAGGFGDAGEPPDAAWR